MRTNLTSCERIAIRKAGTYYNELSDKFYQCIDKIDRIQDAMKDKKPVYRIPYEVELASEREKMSKYYNMMQSIIPTLMTMYNTSEYIIMKYINK